jgi:predicted TPR repeat methyltransferase
MSSANFDAAKAHFLEGVAHAEAGQFEAAEEALAAALAMLPGRASTLINLGAVRLRLGKPQAALAVLDAAVAAAPDDLDAWVHRGAACAALGHGADALASFERALAIDAGHARARYQRAVALHRLGRLGESREALETLLSDDTSNGEAWSLLGQIHRDEGRRDAAADAFERAIASGADPAIHAYLLAALRGDAAPAATPPAYLHALFDDYAEDFETHLVETLRYQAHKAVVQAALAQHGHYRSALDLGCGSGLVGSQLRPHVQRLEGVDLSAAMVERARRSAHYDHLSAAGVIEHLQATPERHDLVVAADLFIYIGDLDPVFAGVRRVLEPGGCFVFSVELIEGTGYCLLPTLRYGHAEVYLRELAQRHSLRWLAAQACALREEQRRPVAGLIVTLGA